MSSFAHFLSVNQSTLYIQSHDKSWKAYGAEPKKKKEEIQNYYNYYHCTVTIFLTYRTKILQVIKN